MLLIVSEVFIKPRQRIHQAGGQLRLAKIRSRKHSAASRALALHNTGPGDGSKIMLAIRAVHVLFAGVDRNNVAHLK